MSREKPCPAVQPLNSLYRGETYACRGHFFKEFVYWAFHRENIPKEGRLGLYAVEKKVVVDKDFYSSLQRIRFHSAPKRDIISTM